MAELVFAETCGNGSFTVSVNNGCAVPSFLRGSRAWRYAFCVVREGGGLAPRYLNCERRGGLARTTSFEKKAGVDTFPPETPTHSLSGTGLNIRRQNGTAKVSGRPLVHVIP
ncbi:hypothetical protein AAFF_G00108410 [Aldrovandia affinis]|uniref:Uncharacterized protein n=1 Tax=Aldrovandia affinis TaxID=143900 RepID=A0AAD7RTW7_9TELE|nr:hypothetical protein AAFF_G00108410 [Aldrovandia affinis]